ncbi:MAG: N-acetyltransferase [Oscillospiraceae bacterium]|nr:N-acetyltransferase [Oscillospiraceae bacterium]
MHIRQAAPADYPAIYDLVKTAFQTAKVSDGTEQDFVTALRARPSYRPELELVAQAESGVLLGHVMLTETRLLAGAGKPLSALMAAPLCVRLQNRGCGLGARLLHEGMRRGRNQGYACVFLVGDPAYYGRFGFRPVTEYGLRNETHAGDRYVLGRPLAPGALEGVCGGVRLE